MSTTSHPGPSEYPAHLYAAVHDGNVGDVEFYRHACAGARSVLELGCGDARVLAAIEAPERVGLDFDAAMLELAAQRDAQLELVCADMSRVGEVLAGRRFERVIIPHGGLYGLLEPELLERTVSGIAKVLAPSGELVLDCWAADAFHAESEPEELEAGWLERVKSIELEGEAWEVLERSSWDKASQRIDATYVHVRVGSEEAVEGLLRQRYVLAAQLRAVLENARLDLKKLSGNFAGDEYDSDAELMVAQACHRDG